MWKPRGGKITSSQTYMSKLLLAYNTKGRPILRKDVRQVPMFPQCYQTTVGTTYSNECLMALRPIGTPHLGTFPYGNAATQIPRRRN